MPSSSKTSPRARRQARIKPLQAKPFTLSSLFTEAWAVMRERLWVYAGLGAACALAGAFGASRFLEAAHAAHPQSATVTAALFTAPALRMVLCATVIALFFILPSALRRVRPDFQMNPPRLVLMLSMFCSMALAVDTGLLVFVIPGLIVSVLISQALFSALLSDATTKERNSFERVIGAFTRSVRMTLGRFPATTGVVLLSLLILLVPFCGVLFCTVTLLGRNAYSLIASAPALFLTFVYFECVRYVMIGRWYEFLESGGPH